mgnify:CR=1 FL=1|jgi:hypothetical protein|tara:strand:+ start:810 stop:1475 length:666 start_codon:yes stop_codon:yes gene_type:complete
MGTITRNLAYNVLTGGVMNRPLIENASIANATSIPAAGGGSFTIVSKNTITNDAYATFSSIGSHKSYLFTFNQVHPEDDNQDIMWQQTFDGSSWNGPKYGGCNEFLSSTTGSHGQYSYRDDFKVINNTGSQKFFRDVGNNNEEAMNGWLWIFQPGNTNTYKTYMGRTWGSIGDIAGTTDGTVAHMFNGFINATSAITGFRFLAPSGNLQSGVITLYGLDQS